MSREDFRQVEKQSEPMSSKLKNIRRNNQSRERFKSIQSESMSQMGEKTTNHKSGSEKCFTQQATVLFEFVTIV